MIIDSKKFNEKIDNFIKKTEYEMSLPPIKVNKGIIREMIERDKILKIKKIQNENEKKYKLSKKKI